MTQHEFVKKESEQRFDKRYVVFKPDEDDELHKDFFTSGYDDGLAKGLEIAKEFADWLGHNYMTAEGGWYDVITSNTSVRIIDELLTIFLTEKYGQ